MTGTEYLRLALPVLLLGIGKGGFPIGSVAIPATILLWPREENAARHAIAFLLPLLCVMDICAVWVYRRSIRWSVLRPVLPATLAGVALGSVLFVASGESALALSDRTLTLAIGLLGIGFVGARMASHGRSPAPATLPDGTTWRPLFYGLGAGLASTLAHAAAPIMQMYFLPLRLEKLLFAGTTAAYFLLLNHVKLIPFALYGRFDLDTLRAAVWLLPVIPVGVLLGHVIVRMLGQRHYMVFIQAVLLLSSLLLVLRGCGGTP